MVGAGSDVRIGYVASALMLDFLTLCKDADPDIPVYKQAKLEYAKLQYYASPRGLSFSGPEPTPFASRVCLRSEICIPHRERFGGEPAYRDLSPVFDGDA